MTDPDAASPGKPKKQPTGSAPRRRRPPAPRAPQAAARVEAPVLMGVPLPAEPMPDHDWPDPEPPTTGAPAVGESAKRKRRRKKGKAPSQPLNAAETVGPAADESPAAAPPRFKHDPELLAQRAWKIYLAEICEEGVALVADTDARELSRRCFRLAEIFLDEQARRA